jgi:hypothetical protein
MRLSDVLGREVVDTEGRSLGRVHDARLVQDGLVLGEVGAAFRLHALVVGRGSIGSRLGYDREHREVKGPWLLQRVFGRRTPTVVPWTSVTRRDRDRIIVESSGQNRDR